VDRFASLVEPVPFGKACQLAGSRRLVAGGHGQVGMLPVAENAQSTEFIALDVDPFTGISATLFTYLGLAHLPLLLAELLIDFQFNRQAMAIPARDIRCIKTLHALAFDNNVFEDLVQRVADMDIAVGIRRAIVQGKVRLVWIRLTDQTVEVKFSPTLYDFRFALRQVAAHRKIGYRKIESFFIVHAKLRKSLLSDANLKR